MSWTELEKTLREHGVTDNIQLLTVQRLTSRYARKKKQDVGKLRADLSKLPAPLLAVFLAKIGRTALKQKRSSLSPHKWLQQIKKKKGIKNEASNDNHS